MQKNIRVRNYVPNDFDQLVKVYQSAFSETPWNEYTKCSICSINYGIKETQSSPKICKKCFSPLRLEEFWSKEEIKVDLEFATSQDSPVVIVAENKCKLIGFTWGYKLPLNKFPFLKDMVDVNTNYMDEIAVRTDMRRMGLGKLIGIDYIERLKNTDVSEIVLRTDRRNEASMNLFKSLNFENTNISDPKYPERIYLWRKIK